MKFFAKHHASNIFKNSQNLGFDPERRIRSDTSAHKPFPRSAASRFFSTLQ
jgi:hypothetical protein